MPINGIETAYKDRYTFAPVTARRTVVHFASAIYRCCDLGDSWVALEHDHEIVGFLLAEPDEWERRGAYGDTQVLNLPYAGVIESHRGRRIFPALARQIMPKGVALTATVRCANKRHMLSGLLKLGFTKANSTDDQDDLRWQPPRP
jgi:hypothetical protein